VGGVVWGGGGGGVASFSRFIMNRIRNLRDTLLTVTSALASTVGS